MATLNDLRTRTSEIQNDTDFVTNSESFYAQAINDASRKIQEMTKILYETSTISTVASTQSYDLPSNYMSMYDDNNCVIYTDSASEVSYPSWVTYDYLKNTMDDLTTATDAKPDYFWIQGDEISFYKIPTYTGADNVSIIHYAYPTTLSGAGDVSDLPDKYKLAIVYLACSIIYETNELYELSDKFENKSMYELNRIDNTNDPLLTAKRSTGNEYIGVSKRGVIGYGGMRGRGNY